MGFHIEMEQFDGNLGFVPIRSKIIPHYVQLRKALDKVENQMMQTGEDISNTKKKLEDPELDEDLRDEIAAEIMQMIDGNLSINQIVDKLANKFENAPKEQISKDVIIMLQSLADKGFVIK